MTGLEEIKKALEGVTPGPWVTYEGSLGYKGDVFAPTSKSVKDCHHIARCFAPRPEQSPLCDLQAIKVVDDAVAAVEANTIYIAAVNPAAITELLSTLESLQRENEELVARANEAVEAANALQVRTDAAEAEARRLHYHMDSAACLFETISENRPADDVDAVMMRVMANEVRTALASTGGEDHAE